MTNSLNESFTFGVEIEFLGVTPRTVQSVLSRKGVNMDRFRGYTHANFAQWKVVTDQSLGRGGDAGELVSPILRGEAGLDELKTVLGFLNEIEDLHVRRNCGLHVHLAWEDMSAQHVKNVVRRYAEFEGEIDAFMPPSRRGSGNQWCGSLAGFGLNNIASASTLSGVGRAARGRYFKMNVQQLCGGYGTVEFRHHSGTTEYTKIANWVRFLVAFVEESKAAVFGIGGASAHYVPANKRAAFCELREQVEAAGGVMQYSGGQWWKLTGADGIEKRITVTELLVPYNGHSTGAHWKDWTAYDKKLNPARFAEFWENLFPSDNAGEADHTFAGVPETVKEFYATRKTALS
jgi:hypothetical protein